jgi:hypothetical protein
MREHAKSVSSAMDASLDTDRAANEVTYRLFARRTIEVVLGRDSILSGTADRGPVSRPDEGRRVAVRLPRPTISKQLAEPLSTVV